ncbi:hypothetical protein DSM3645_16865 [Blastopirellula marina DSM 3645]|uniref:Uncharacterized protein n=1 Tax=Blastopirellula marina DSM 3645 TaxID=314230 RepID=A3ZNE8_9BACT|nr:hypothetical protein DSM3645_16865 [Blastopirellula marina DSM 3645]
MPKFPFVVCGCRGKNVAVESTRPLKKNALESSPHCETSHEVVADGVETYFKAEKEGALASWRVLRTRKKTSWSSPHGPLQKNDAESGPLRSHKKVERSGPVRPYSLDLRNRAAKKKVAVRSGSSLFALLAQAGCEAGGVFSAAGEASLVTNGAK